ncbi:hypothetical protein F5148DRAFT_742983 [Russula earlei]|uniref:Uncharacterized protein n=1 Tax=Russula earlei TaxID=71964 RepID=A0ACC0TT86_9AGAM|nr:hypothetical protein F5148DRAFT_742983 [Russula earlei]
MATDYNIPCLTSTRRCLLCALLFVCACDDCIVRSANLYSLFPHPSNCASNHDLFPFHDNEYPPRCRWKCRRRRSFCRPCPVRALRQVHDCLWKGADASHYGKICKSLLSKAKTFGPTSLPFHLRNVSPLTSTGSVVMTAGLLEVVLGPLPVYVLLRLFGHYKDSGERMVYPLTALFFETGNQTPFVASIILVGAQRTSTQSPSAVTALLGTSFKGSEYVLRRAPSPCKRSRDVCVLEGPGCTKLNNWKTLPSSSVTY